ncbi:MAG: PIN domain-containing protein [Verrucomicrobia bacterium]|nr:PIN domain-containing protein [Verrucomicrobiota bacterium]
MAPKTCHLWTMRGSMPRCMAEDTVFLDTSGVYAWINRNDPWHAAMCELPKKKSRLVLTDYIVDEACSLFVARKIPHHRRRLFHLLDHSRIITLSWIGPGLFAQARDWMLQYEDQPFSFTDCTSFACMKHLGLTEAASTDQHFRSAGFAPLFT